MFEKEGNIMSFLQTIKEVVAWKKDEEFFDKEATIKEYFKVCPPDKRRKVNSYDELYIEALKYVDKQSFEENTKDMEDYFYEMTLDEGEIAVCIGIFAYNIACNVDKNGAKWETKLNTKVDKKFYTGFDKNNPFDRRVGGNHRYFGHDIFTFGLKRIPWDFLICQEKIPGGYNFVPIGKVLGKQYDEAITMLDLIWYYYGDKNNPIAGIFNCAGHTIVHFAKDLLTTEGVPLPFSGLLTDYGLPDVDDIGIEQNDTELKNKFNDWVNKYNGNMKASDFASLAFIEGMCKLYTAQKKLGEKAESFNRDLKIIAMGTCIMIQMSSMILNQKGIIKKGKDQGKKAMVPGAKWNVILTGAMMKAMTQEMAEVTKVRNEINKKYSEKIKEMNDNE